MVAGGRTALDNKTSLLNTPSPRSFAGPRFRDYNPYNYTDSISTLDKAALKEALYEDSVEQLRDGEGRGLPLPSGRLNSSCRVCKRKVFFFHRWTTRICRKQDHEPQKLPR